MFRLITICLVLLLLIIPGCSFFNSKAPDEPKTPPKAEEPKPAKEAKRDYYVGIKAPVPGIQEWVKRYKLYEGVFLQQKDDYRLVLISMGEKFVPGYSLSLEKVDKQSDKWVVRVSFKEEETTPEAAPETYIPWEVVAIQDDGKPIEVIDTSNLQREKPLGLIEIPKDKELPISKSFIVFQPLAGEQVANPVLIKGKARIFEANFRIIIRSGDTELASKILMADQGAPGWGNFEAAISYQKPVNSNIEIVFAYENMENGELIEELVVPVVAEVY